MPDDTPQPIRQVVAAPADRLWFDPRVIVGNCECVFSNVTLSAASSVQLCAADPTRIAVGFAYPVGAVNSLRHGPWNDVVTFTFPDVNQASAAWYYLNVHLNIVTYAWYGFSATNDVVRVTEIRRR